MIGKQIRSCSLEALFLPIYVLLSSGLVSYNVHQHIINITMNDEASSISSHNDQHPAMHLTQNENQRNGSTDITTHQTSSYNKTLYIIKSFEIFI